MPDFHTKTLKLKNSYLQHHFPILTLIYTYSPRGCGKVVVVGLQTHVLKIFAKDNLETSDRVHTRGTRETHQRVASGNLNTK